MSTICLTVEEIVTIANNLLGSQYRDMINFENEKLEHQALLQKELSYDDIDRAILCFVDRLWIANQLAYCYTYKKNDTRFTVDCLSSKDLEQTTPVYLSANELLEQLQNLDYNLVTNNGRSFVSEEDMTRLHTLISRLTSYIIYHTLQLNKVRI